MLENELISSWYFCNTHNFFCGCDNCKKLLNLGFNEVSAKIFTASLELSLYYGGDAGGAYSDFETEALPAVLGVIEKMFRSAGITQLVECLTANQPGATEKDDNQNYADTAMQYEAK